MSFVDEGKTIIRVAVNEMQKKSLNPAIPYTPAEVARDSIACGRAGASIVHFHSRTDDGEQALDDDAHTASRYRDALELTAHHSDILLEPTNLPRGDGLTSADDTPHFWLLSEHPPSSGRWRLSTSTVFDLGTRRSARTLTPGRSIHWTVRGTTRARPIGSQT